MKQVKRDVFCSVPLSPIRKEASDRAEIVTQAFFGESLKVLEESEKWAIVESTFDGYQGWIDKKQIQSSVESTESAVLNLPLQHANHIRYGWMWLPAGSSIVLKEFSNAHELKHGILPSESQSVALRAEMFLNAPYLWGGKSILGIDCSGFTQTVFKLCGIQLMRDAFQQADQGTMLDFVEEAQTGDLAFFDNAEGRIIHVGIVLKQAADMKIIHASGKVRIDNLDHQGIFNPEVNAYTHNLRFIKRIL